jgi:Pyruvate/2-oxoacid:ferredoxin oxidoreductase delta subunit
MMDASAFDHHFKKIKSKWRTTFTEDLGLQVYHIVKYVPQDEFAKWVDSIIWSKEPPDRNAFWNLANKFKSERPQQNFDECKYCSNIGTVIASKKEVETEYDFCFACTFCQRGEKEPAIVPRWGENWANAGYKLHLPEEMKPDAQVIQFKSKFTELVESKDMNKIVNDDDVF